MCSCNQGNRDEIDATESSLDEIRNRYPLHPDYPTTESRLKLKCKYIEKCVCDPTFGAPPNGLWTFGIDDILLLRNGIH